MRDAFSALLIENRVNFILGGVVRFFCSMLDLNSYSEIV